MNKLEIRAQRDLRPAPGRKSSQEIKIDSQSISESPKIEKLDNEEKQPKTSGFIDFSTLNMHFRSADAANHLNARPRAEIRVTRRAYIPKIYKLEE